MARYVITVYFLVVFNVAAPQLSAQRTSTITGERTEWADKWTGSLDYTLEVLALVTEADLDFRPTEDQMTLREQFQHMATNVYSLTSRFLHQPEGFELAEARKAMSPDANKRSLKKTLRAAYEFGQTAYLKLDDNAWDTPADDFWAGPKSKRVIFNLLQDHATHHRAQTLVYLRLLGYQPPRYRGW